MSDIRKKHTELSKIVAKLDKAKGNKHIQDLVFQCQKSQT